MFEISVFSPSVISISSAEDMPYTYDFPRPALTVDCVIFGLDESHKLKVLLIQRAHAPFKGQWVLPGGFVDMEEGLEAAALRELEEETGVKGVFIEQLYTFGDPGRDPRGRVVSVAYFALVNLEEHPVEASSDARRVKWFETDNQPQLAFDHKNILQVAIARLRAKVRYQPIGFELLPEKFTIPQLKILYDAIYQKELDRRNFRKKILSMNILEKLDEKDKTSSRKGAFLYRFDKAKYEELSGKGFDFEL